MWVRIDFRVYTPLFSVVFMTYLKVWPLGYFQIAWLRSSLPLLPGSSFSFCLYYPFTAWFWLNSQITVWGFGWLILGALQLRQIWRTLPWTPCTQIRIEVCKTPLFLTTGSFRVLPFSGPSDSLVFSRLETPKLHKSCSCCWFVPVFFGQLVLLTDTA